MSVQQTTIGAGVIDNYCEYIIKYFASAINIVFGLTCVAIIKLIICFMSFVYDSFYNS